MVNYNLFVLHGYKNAKPQRFWVTYLTFWNQVTSSVTWPLHSAWALCCWWLMLTMRLSCTVMEIKRFKFAF